MPSKALGLQTEGPLGGNPSGAVHVAAFFHRFRDDEAGVLAQAVVHRVGRVDHLNHAAGGPKLERDGNKCVILNLAKGVYKDKSGDFKAKVDSDTSYYKLVMGRHGL